MGSRELRIAIGGILTECNQLGGLPIDLAAFDRYELRRGQAVLGAASGVVGGMLRTLAGRRALAVPLLFASTCPGGPLTAECYGLLKSELLDRLRASLPVDGLLLPLHGAAAAQNAHDLEGDLIRAAREVVGPSTPIVGTLDLHAHVTADMVGNATGLVAWETYPHRDAFTTGVRGANLLLDTLDGRVRPAMAMAKVPVITGAIRGSTEGDDPFADLMRSAKALEGRNGVLSASVFMVHPFLDQPDMGSGALVIVDGDMGRAVGMASAIAAEYWSRRHDLEPRLHTPGEAVSLGLAIDGGPVVLVEAADCCGGGAAGDSVASLAPLLRARRPALLGVTDPEAASACHRAGAGSEVSVTLGHRLDPRWGSPVPVSGRVERLSDGRFRYVGGIWEGVEGNMGPSAVLSIGPVRVLVSTHGTYDWADEQFRSVGLDPGSAKFVVAKNPMNYRMAYGPIARGTFILDTPGPTPPTLRHVVYRRLRRPYFPLDEEIPGMVPVIHRSTPF